MRSYLSNPRSYTTRSQMEQLTPDQIQNNEGGYIWSVDKWDRLRRFLVLGSEGGTYYAGERELTKENVRGLDDCIQENASKTARMIHEMRDRAPKRDVIFYSWAYTFTKGDQEAKSYIESNFNYVVRTGSDLLQFVAFIDEMRGWGRSLRRLVSSWYEYHQLNSSLAYQMLKYQNRFGWSHKDVLRRCRYGSKGEVANLPELRWTVKSDLDERLVRRKDSGVSTYYEGIDQSGMPHILDAYEEIKAGVTEERLCALIETNRMSHEMVPNNHKNSPKVWEALLGHMPMTAMIRNLGKMSNVGLLGPMSSYNPIVLEKLDAYNVAKSKVHPIQFIMAYLTYGQGHGTRGSLRWDPVGAIVKGLEDAFYTSFGNVEPTGKNMLIGIDVSGSMMGGEIAGAPGLTPAFGAITLAMVAARRETNCHIMGFDHGMIDLNITAADTLESALQKGSCLNYGGTDCSLPMKYATSKGWDIDAFLVLTDSETYYGDIHPSEALARYRKSRKDETGSLRDGSPLRKAKESASKARLAVIGMTSNNFTIADPNDPGMLDVVGFDSATPQLLSNFFKGEI